MVFYPYTGVNLKGGFLAAEARLGEISDKNKTV
jgi:hypothetical protein